MVMDFSVPELEVLPTLLEVDGTRLLGTVPEGGERTGDVEGRVEGMGMFPGREGKKLHFNFFSCIMSSFPDFLETSA